MCQHYVEDLLGTRHFIRQSYNNLARWTYYHFAGESSYPRSVMTPQPGLLATPQGSSVQTWGRALCSTCGGLFCEIGDPFVILADAAFTFQFL